MPGSKGGDVSRPGEYPEKKHLLTPCLQPREYGGCERFLDLLGLKGA